MKKIAVYMAAFNTVPKYFTEALESIKMQEGFIITVYIGIDKPHKWDQDRLTKIKEIAHAMNFENPKVFGVALIENPLSDGISDAANMLLRPIMLGGYDYVCRLDHDDVYLPNKIKKQIAFMEESGADFCGTYGELIDENSKVTDPNWPYGRGTTTPRQYLLNNGNCLIHSSIMFRKELVEKGRIFYHPLFNMSCEDYELWLRLVAEKYKVGICPEVLLQYRVHSAQASNMTEMKDAWRKTQEATKVFYRTLAESR